MFVCAIVKDQKARPAFSVVRNLDKAASKLASKMSTSLQAGHHVLIVRHAGSLGARQYDRNRRLVDGTADDHQRYEALQKFWIEMAARGKHGVNRLGLGPGRFVRPHCR